MPGFPFEGTQQGAATVVCPIASTMFRWPFGAVPTTGNSTAGVDVMDIAVGTLTVDFMRKGNGLLVRDTAPTGSSPDAGTDSGLGVR